MTKHIRRPAAAAAYSSWALVLALRFAHAGVIFDAQFAELWFTAGQQADSDADTENDQFLFSLTQDDAQSYNVTLDGVLVTFDSGIFVDLSDSFGEPWGIDWTVPYWDLPIAQGSTTLGLGFSGFSIGNLFAFNIDLDDNNAVVRGTNGFGSNMDFAGSTVEVFYTDTGKPKDATFTFGECDPVSPSDCSPGNRGSRGALPPRHWRFWALDCLGWQEFVAAVVNRR